MKKRIMAAAIAALFTFNALTVFGAEVKKQKLTVEEAAGYAIANSTELRKLADDTTINDASYKDAKDNLLSSQTESQYLSYSTTILQSSLKTASYINDEKLKKESIEMSITEYFAAIIKAEKDLELYDQQLVLAKKDLDIVYVKKELGLLSETDYQTEKTAYNKKLNERELELVAIDKAYISLNKIMAKTLTNRYDLQLKFNYTALGNVYLQAQISQATDKSYSLKSKQDDVTVAYYNMNHPLGSYSDDDKKALEIKYEQAGRSLSDEKDSIAEQITTFYNSIRSAETTYNSNQLELKEMKAQLAIKQKQLELGKITALDVEKYKFKIVQLEETIRSSVYDHEIKILKFKNPVLITG